MNEDNRREVDQARSAASYGGFYQPDPSSSGSARSAGQFAYNEAMTQRERDKKSKEFWNSLSNPPSKESDLPYSPFFSMKDNDLFDNLVRFPLGIFIVLSILTPGWTLATIAAVAVFSVCFYVDVIRNPGIQRAAKKAKEAEMKAAKEKEDLEEYQRRYKWRTGEDYTGGYYPK